MRCTEAENAGSVSSTLVGTVGGVPLTVLGSVEGGDEDCPGDFDVGAAALLVVVPAVAAFRVTSSAGAVQPAMTASSTIAMAAPTASAT